jgi:hypothetical protein
MFGQPEAGAGTVGGAAGFDFDEPHLVIGPAADLFPRFGLVDHEVFGGFLDEVVGVGDLELERPAVGEGAVGVVSFPHPHMLGHLIPSSR